MFIYTREAHPGENVGHHDSFERKLACARLLAEEAGIGRDILVDDLDGAVHRVYGLMPNYDFHVTLDAQVAPVEYNTYSAYARGTDLLTGTYNWLDLTPYGRQEDWERPPGRGDSPFMSWLRRHDEYDD